MTLDIILSLAGILAGGLLFGLANWRAGLPHDSPEPRWIPWRFLTILSVFWIILIVAHLLNVVGFETGPGKSPFGGSGFG